MAAGQAMWRGVVLPMTMEEIRDRALYLASDRCVAGYYLLHDHNGGKDPTAPDPFDRWKFQGKDGEWHTAVTADCIGGAAWCGGFDRFQPVRFAHIYGGWINTDSMIMDARGPGRCFVELDRPEPGCFVVCASGSRGHKVGHIGTVVTVPAEWDKQIGECWSALGVVDVASTGAGRRANTLRTGRGWFDTNAAFVRSIMEP